ncbi:MAG TPA: sigma 54-interacting transcriptional regulator [Gemmatimonadales bacterium]|nr:sigma 54-interacting transcriptional regulator [Gemmatimonadales bacterium]
MILTGYRIQQEIYRGRRRVVLRGLRRQDGLPVIIKTAADEFPTPAQVAALRREYEILTSVRTGGVVRALELVEREGRLALVLEDAGGASLKSLLAAGPLDLGSFFPLASRLVAIVSALHRQGIIHKDLNPNNILVDRAAGRVMLADFGIAARVTSEYQPLQPPHLLEGTIAYMSPEQTGRMNRDVDYRSDLYSLGVTFYEMLTGRLPFDSPDPLEVIHGHIAQPPVSPADAAPGLPRVVSDLVLKLLAKAPEDRYQSGRGLEADLTRCAAEWHASGAISDQPLGQADVPERFVIPQRLYGREAEVAALQEAFERAAEGGTGLLLVAGHSGIGKTSLIQELHKSLPRRRGRFTSGKFDQQGRDVPYAALVQAFRGLVRQLLSEDDEQIQRWAERLRAALGGNAQVMVDVIPELDRILGPQPPVPALGAHEAQNRFNLVFQRFAGALARPEHPLLLFLDDLQWADAGTLSVLPLLLSAEIAGLLVVGAYRDNEVPATHPLRLAIGDLLAAGAPVREMTLPPLGAEPLGRFIADALRTAPARAAPVADLVLGKTGGNPFFVTQILRSLHQDGVLAYDAAAGEWVTDLSALRRTQITDNVIDLMAAKIQRLAPPAQRALRLAACVGARFDLHTLGIVSERKPDEAAADLWEAVEHGLVLPIEKSYGYAPDLAAGLDPAAVRYRFLHDRVQQAAYLQIPEEARREVHLTVGRLLLTHGGGTEDAESLFEVVNHLNYGSALITDPAERIRLAQLNLAAGRKSKASAAYQSALSYFAAGAALLSDAAWTESYLLAFALHLEQAEALYLCGRFAEAEAGFTALLERCRSPLERTDVYALLIVQFETMSRYGDAIRAGIDGLRLLGVDLPSTAAERASLLAEDMTAIGRRLGTPSVAALLDLPRVEDPSMRQAMRLLMGCWAPSYISSEGVLCDLVAARMVRLSLEHGACEETAFAYIAYATTVGYRLGDYAQGHEFGRAALELNERYADLRLRAVVHHRFAALVNPWCRPFASCFPHAREAVRAALESGNLQVAGYAQFQQSWYGTAVERDLGGYRERYTASVDFLARLGNPAFLGAQRLLLQWARALEGDTEAPTSFTGEGFDEAEFIATAGRIGIFRGLYAALKLELLQTFEQVGEARALARDAEAAAELFFGSIWPAMFAFRHALTLCAWLPTAPGAERAEAEAKLDELLARLERWAAGAPQNFRHLHLLAAAEAARVRDRPGEAATLYESALEAAACQESPRHRALVNELYGKFWLLRQRRSIAAAFLAEARYGYASWGAMAKVADLDHRYGDLLRDWAHSRAASPPGSGVLQTTEALPSALDAVAVARAARAISGEIELEKLLERLLRVALESAGAERGCLLLEQDGQAAVHVHGSAEAISVRTQQPTPLDAAELPASVVNFVRHSGESVVLGDATVDPQYRADPYIARERPRSVLCAPVLHLGQPLAVLYLENRLTAHAFTAERAQLMEILSSQAAISIQNARLFAEVSRLRDRLQAENVYLKEEIKVHHGFEDIVGRSAALQRMLAQAEQVAPSDTTVLVTGETGTGKELLARAIHNLSPRRERPMVAVNCGAISPGLVESELFGHERGAFTGAVARRIGRFELADGGTLFLDEVGDLPLDLQVKLLRVLQEGEIERVGGTRPIKVNVRVIAATHRDLAVLVHEGQFRADLFYRLHVFPIRTPALRERPEDIPELVRHFVLKYAAKLGKRFDAIPKGVLDRLTAYAWPGNIRELGNVVERSVILSQGSTLQLDEWQSPRDTSEGSAVAVMTTLEDLERRHIVQVLEQTGWRVSGPKGAAQLLGLKPTTLEARMKKLGVQRPSASTTS